MVKFKDFTDVESELSPLITRWNEDRDLVYNVAYEMLDFDSKGKKKIPGVYHVTIPLAATYLMKAVAKLVNVERRYNILTEDEELNTSTIIKFLGDADFEIDAMLVDKKKQDAHSAHSNYICIRGWVAELILWHIKDGNLVPDSRPLDMRFVKWKNDGRKLKWVSVKMIRSKNDILALYPEAQVSGKNGELELCYDKDYWYIYVDKKRVRRVRHGYGYVPCIIHPVAYGPMLEERNSIKHTGESIFYPHRDMYAEFNFMASAEKTMVRDALRPALQTPDEKDWEGPYVESGDILTDTKPLTVVPRGDLTNSGRAFSGIISQIIQMNSFSISDYGSITAPMSGAALDTLGASGSEILLSRFVGLANFYQRRYKMIIDQFIQLDETLSIGRPGMSHEYKPSDLEGEYAVEVEYIEKSLRSIADRANVAASLRGTMPMSWIRAEIMQPDDPKLVEAEMEREEAERQHPVINLIDQVNKHIEADTDEDDEKARYLAGKVVAIIKAEVAGRVALPEPGERPKPRQLPAQRRIAGGQERPADQGTI